MTNGSLAGGQKDFPARILRIIIEEINVWDMPFNKNRIHINAFLIVGERGDYLGVVYSHNMWETSVKNWWSIEAYQLACLLLVETTFISIDF